MDEIKLNCLRTGDKKSVFVAHKKHHIYQGNKVKTQHFTNLNDARAHLEAYNQFLTLTLMQLGNFQSRVFTAYQKIIPYNTNYLQDDQTFKEFATIEKLLRNMPRKAVYENGPAYVYANMTYIDTALRNICRKLMIITKGRNLTMDTFELLIILDQLQSLRWKIDWWPECFIIFDKMNL